MFTPPGPENKERKDGGGSKDTQEKALLVDVEEDYFTMDHLLRFCYPVENPQLESSKEICLVLAAARKYAVNEVLPAIHAQFVFQAKADPVEMYAYACQFNWPEEKGIAAKAYLLSPPIDSLDCSSMEAMDHMSARDYLRLIRYRQRCSEAASQNLYDVVSVANTTEQVYVFSWVERDDWVWTDIVHQPSKIQFASKANVARVPADWFIFHMGLLKEKLKACPRALAATGLNDPYLTIPTIVRAFEQCDVGPRCGCMERTVSELFVFNRLIRRRVEHLISEVHLEA